MRQRKTHRHRLGRSLLIAISSIAVLLLSFFLPPSPPPQDTTSEPAPLPILASPSGTLTTVTRVIDGDTIKIDTGQTVRLIGIDTPETVDPRRPVMCYGKEASEKTKSLLEGNTITLEKDITEQDKYGRLLRYVWQGDELVNELLIREGYAKSSSFPPDIKYQDRFRTAERLAKVEQRGLWSNVCALRDHP